MDEFQEEEAEVVVMEQEVRDEDDITRFVVPGDGSETELILEIERPKKDSRVHHNLMRPLVPEYP